MAEPVATRIGTCGWMYRNWRELLYPRKLPVRSWLHYYTTQFNAVEVNNTFYGQPPAMTFDGWRRQAAPGFLFAVKANRLLTHRHKLKDAERLLPAILQPARRLGPYLGPILYQLPPHWRCDLERLRQFIGQLPTDLSHVFEFRDRSWYNDEVRALLAETGMAFCIHDMPGLSSPLWVTGRVVYLRFHGPAAVKYSGRYEPNDLRTWAARIRSYRQTGHEVHAFFNNTDQAGHAVINARELQQLLHGQPVPSLA